MSSSLPDLIEQLRGVGRDRFTDFVAAECKNQAGEGVAEALRSDYKLADRWVGTLRWLAGRARSNLEMNEVQRTRDDDWVQRTTRFAGMVEARLDEATGHAIALRQLRRIELDAADTPLLRSIAVKMAQGIDRLDLRNTGLLPWLEVDEFTDDEEALLARLLEEAS